MRQRTLVYDSLMTFSSMQALDELVAAGMPSEQARAVVRGMERQHEDAATRGDLEGTEERIYARMETLFWRGVAMLSAVNIGVGGLIIGAIAAFD